MGHGSSELPRTSAEQEAEETFQRKLKVREAIQDIPLGYFKARDLEPLVKLFVRTGDWPNRSEVEQLEARLEEIKSGEIDLDPNLT